MDPPSEMSALLKRAAATAPAGPPSAVRRWSHRLRESVKEAFERLSLD